MKKMKKKIKLNRIGQNFRSFTPYKNNEPKKKIKTKHKTQTFKKI